MSTRTLHASGPLPADAVWERFAVPGRWPEWEEQVQRVDLATERLTPGATGRLHVGYGVALPFTVEAVDEAARRFAWTVKVGLLKLRLELSVAPAPGGGSTAVMTANGPGPLVAGYAGRSQASLQRAVEPSS
jgi:Polyketide cyclase / dehydrase and lipid transport